MWVHAVPDQGYISQHGGSILEPVHLSDSDRTGVPPRPWRQHQA